MPNNDNVTLSADERAALRAQIAADTYEDRGYDVLRLLDALDAETARADAAERVAAKQLSWAIFAIRDHDAYAQPFVLMRDTDVSGVSGTGVVADGVAFPDGTVALRWRGGNPTSVVFHDNGVASVEAIHGHGGNTRIVWLAEDLETTAEVAAAYDALDAETARAVQWLGRYDRIARAYNVCNKERLSLRASVVAETARHRRMTEAAMRFRRERDEARAEVERLRSSDN